MEKIEPSYRSGHLTVLEDSGQRQGDQIIWSCQCDCGEIVLADTDQLLRKAKQNCGCQAKRKNLIGRRFGELTVVDDLGIGNGYHVWQCQCDCGNTCEVTQDHLIQNRTHSCGCRRKQIAIKNLNIVDGTSVARLERKRGQTQSNNTSGYPGVYALKNCKTPRWVAQIGFQRKNYYLGTYETLNDAISARMAAEEKFYDGFLKEYYEKRS